ncbi:MAG: class I tRNA ligase family protein [Candidatus Aenigmarchaeota archaeon]|nr:class I tRNA ligase family protein [Candidatus Aenigmarchaeota archaeon]
MNHVKFYVKETATDMGEFVTIATTRPELLPACKLIIYNPEDTRYAHLQGRTAIVPIFGQEIPIMPHPYAKPDFGTGLVMICSFGDYGDVRVLRELDITPTYAIDTQGRMTREAGRYKGLLVTDARKAVIEDLRAHQLIVKEDPVTQSQPVCWRSKNPIEFVSMKELYLKQVEFKDDIMKIANTMTFYAPESRQILIDWISSINIDWVISRRRYYGTEVPLWHCAACKTTVVPPPGKYYQPWKQSSPVKRCPKCGKSKFIGDTRTFDTWFDSSSSEYYILGYMWDKAFWRKNMPCTLRPQGKDIVRTWLYFSLLKAWLLDKQQAFENCWINMHVVDDKGEKMSKSLGNGIDPQEVLKRFGADTFRTWVCLEGDITKSDMRCSFDRIEGTGKFLTKFWNISRFISMFPQVQPQDAKKLRLEAADRWILAELANLVRFVKEKYDAYEFNAAVTAIRDFTWDTFAAHYIEMVKPRAYVMQGSATVKHDGKDAKPVKPDEKTLLAAKAAWYTLHECLRTLLLLLAPPVPFVSESVWSQLYAKAKSESVHGLAFPEADKPDKKMLEMTKTLKDFNSMIWNMKKEGGLSLRDPVNMEVPKELKAFEHDMKAMHNLGGKVEPKPELSKCEPAAQPQKPQTTPAARPAQKHEAKPAKKRKA